MGVERRTTLLMVAEPIVLMSCTTSSTTKITTSSDGIFAAQWLGGPTEGRDANRRFGNSVRKDVAVSGWLLCSSSGSGSPAARPVRRGKLSKTAMTELPAHTTRRRGWQAPAGGRVEG